jgi:hypothetical protein
VRSAGSSLAGRSKLIAGQCGNGNRYQKIRQGGMVVSLATSAEKVMVSSGLKNRFREGDGLDSRRLNVIRGSDRRLRTRRAPGVTCEHPKARGTPLGGD